MIRVPGSLSFVAVAAVLAASDAASLAACASREPRPDNLIVLQPEDAGPELDVPLNASRPGGPLDIKPGDAWFDPPDAGAPIQTFPMRVGGRPTPTEDVMPGAFPPHGQQ